ncbi:LysR family transcriptional regulator [Curvivirga sp.]|uniref:LysR family transcriptional regulator n=1 Tax=Curvivirga sp. TaxID=2856848 RepID=UPI003B5AD777
MQDFNFHSIDLQHLRMLSILFEEKHISRTADRLGITQSAVSKVLSKLREQFSDALLIRAKGGYQLSHKAHTLEPQLNDLLAQAASLFSETQDDPSEFEAEIRIAMADDIGILILPELIAALSKAAPKIKLGIHHRDPSTFDKLATGKIDLILEEAPPKGSGYYTHRLMNWGWRCVMNPNHPLATDPWDIQTYCKAKHGLVSFSGDRFGVIDEILGTLNKERDLCLTVPFFSAIPYIISQNQVIFTIPEPLASQYAKNFNLITKPVPFDIPPLNISLIWHHRNQYDSIHSWLRSFLLEQDFLNSSAL